MWIDYECHSERVLVQKKTEREKKKKKNTVNKLTCTANVRVLQPTELQYVILSHFILSRVPL